ncbi:MAG: 4-(cytidine 5'-diphospho)-2-C-methyl-D-erythritol kinase [Geminicoccaceae bacterium]
MPSPPPAEPPLVERAPAKLNLDLLLTGRRPNGYHELDSVVVFAELGDRLTLRPHSELLVECTGPFGADLPAGDGNIVRRAALRLAGAVGAAPRVAITLDTRLPVASGIGGGSADAAATLRGLARLWGIAPDAPVLTGTALALGSDVLACLHSRSARMRGIGEQIEFLPPTPPLDLVLLNPGLPLGTPEVFALVRPEQFATRPGPVPERLDAGWLATSRNDLEAPARRLLPAIGAVLAALESTPGCRLARMSGSGPTCFGLFDGAAAARAAAATLAAAHPGWWSAATRAGAESAMDIAPARHRA